MQTNWLYGVERVSWYLNLAATLGLICSLAWNQLYRVYRWLFAYLIADATQTIIGLTAGRINQNVYGWTYVAGQLVKIVLAVLVVLELYKLALERHPALARFGRQAVSYALAVAATLSACGLVLDRSVPPEQSKVLHWLNSFERTMDTAMLIFLLAVTLFLTWFPVRLKRNATLYIGGFLIYFLSRSAGLLLLNVAPGLRRTLGTAMLAAGVICLLTWLVALQRAGEEITTVIGHRWDPSAADRLTGQLDAINAWLLRLSRRSG
jgi:hypothetical protein